MGGSVITCRCRVFRGLHQVELRVHFNGNEGACINAGTAMCLEWIPLIKEIGRYSVRGNVGDLEVIIVRWDD